MLLLGASRWDVVSKKNGLKVSACLRCSLAGSAACSGCRGWPPGSPGTGCNWEVDGSAPCCPAVFLCSLPRGSGPGAAPSGAAAAAGPALMPSQSSCLFVLPRVSASPLLVISSCMLVTLQLDTMQVVYIGVVPTGRRQHIGRALEPWTQLPSTSAPVGNIAVTGEIHQAGCQACALDSESLRCLVRARVDAEAKSHLCLHRGRASKNPLRRGVWVHESCVYSEDMCCEATDFFEALGFKRSAGNQGDQAWQCS